MMSSDNNCPVCGKKGHIGHHCPQAQCYNCNDFSHFAQDCPRRFPNKGHPIIIIDLTTTHIITTATGRSHTPSIIDTAKGTALTGQDHAIYPSVTEDPVTTGGMHPILYLAILAILTTPLQTGTLKDIPTGIPNIDTGATYLVTHNARVTPNTTLLILVSPTPGTPQVLPIDCTPGKYQSHVHRQRPQ